MTKGSVQRLSLLSKNTNYYIHRIVGRTRDGSGIFQYMWKDGTWHDTCGSQNMFRTKEAAEEHLYLHETLEGKLLDEDLFKI